MRAWDPSQPIFFLCRSGVRSMAAAQGRGGRGVLARSYNIAHGFRGGRLIAAGGTAGGRGRAGRADGPAPGGQ